MSKIQKSMWALAFSQAMHEWFRKHDMTATELGLRLGLPKQKWWHAVSGSYIVDIEIYNRTFCFTGLPEADPRKVPDRKNGSGFISRALSEREWQSWLAEYGDLYKSESAHQIAITAAQPPPPEVEKLSEAEEASIEEVLDVAIELLQSWLEKDEPSLKELQMNHGPQLGRLYKLLTLVSMENPVERKIALRALQRYPMKIKR